MVPQKVVYIYPDVAFAVSLLMNGLILWGTAKISKIYIGCYRIIGGAGLGALYSFAAAFPQLGILANFWFKITFSIAMIALVFAPAKINKFAAITATFYFVSFALGGSLIGMLYFINTSPLYFYLGDLSQLAAEYFLPALLITVFSYIIVTKYAGRLFQKRIRQDVFLVPVAVWFDGSETKVQALIDTGNSLHDPLTNIPVIVIQYDAIKSMFPREIREAFDQGNDTDLMYLLECISTTRWSTRFRIIPFTSLGKENGLLVGFKPDYIEIFNGKSQLSTNKVIVGVYRQELSPEGGYSALLHPEILDLSTA